MSNRKIFYALLILLFLIAVIFGLMIFQNQKELKVIFLNVGQGDSALIMQGNKQVLIDGGPDGQILLEKLGKYVPFWDRKIEMVIATHPDQDHIQGLADVLEKYEVQSVLQTFDESDSQIYKKYKDLLGLENTNILEARPGAGAEFPSGAKIEILAPLEERKKEKDTNINSVVARLDFGENSFLFTGDAPMEEENDLLKTNQNISADVLKISHHGSKYSTSREFLEKVKPQEAIISVGKNNYGHPTPEILERLEEYKIKIFRTDEKGDIEFRCLNVSEACAVAN